MGGILDPFLRGFNESLMDTNLSETEVQNLKGITAIFGKEIKSKLDAQFGFILGFSYAKFLMQFLILKNRMPNQRGDQGVLRASEEASPGDRLHPEGREGRRDR